MAETKDKFLRGKELGTYTTLVKKAISDAVGETTDEKVIQGVSTETTDIPVIIKGASSDSTAAHVKYDSGVTIKPQTHELKATNGDNVATVKPSEVSVTDGTNTTKITASGITLPASAKPTVTYTKSSGKVKVSMGGQTSDEVSLATADASNYGVVKVDASLNASSTNTVQNKAAKAGIDAAAKTVRQTAQTGDSALPILTAVSASPTSGNNAEAGYDTAMTFNPGTDTLSITAASSNTTITPTRVRVESGTGAESKIAVLEGSSLGFAGVGLDDYGMITAKEYTGKAIETERSLASTNSGSEGATMVGYKTNTTVKDALDDIYETIGGDSGGNSLTDRVTALESDKQDKLTAGDNISFSGTGDTTINAVDEKVKQSAANTDTTSYPMLLAGSSSPNGTSQTAKYTSFITATPSTKTIEIQGLAVAQTPIEKTQITPTGITFYYNVTSPETGSLNPVSNTGTLTGSDYSGTAAKATADGNGLNIAANYALKSEVINPEPTIVTALPTTQTDIEAMKGKFVFIKDSGASTDTRNVYTEYIAVKEGSTWKMERIGSTEVNVDIDYLTDTEVTNIWNNPNSVLS